MWVKICGHCLRKCVHAKTDRQTCDCVSRNLINYRAAPLVNSLKQFLRNSSALHFIYSFETSCGCRLGIFLHISTKLNSSPKAHNDSGLLQLLVCETRLGAVWDPLDSWLRGEKEADTKSCIRLLTTIIEIVLFLRGNSGTPRGPIFWERI